jgi:SAM-dependent methyltransferase
VKAVAEFDEFAGAYEAHINEALSVSGENKDYFARGRVSFLADCLRHLRENPQAIMDYGCGVGGTTPLLRDLLGSRRVIGLDMSERSLDRARREYGSDNIGFDTFAGFQPAADLDLVYCNGVFHHVPADEQGAAVRYIYDSLRPGGCFALWENNPWNPGTRYVMSKCLFDRNARTLSPPRAKRLLEDGGFQIVRTDFVFYFPRVLKLLRSLEPALRGLPFGAQYQVLCRKPSS